MCGIFGYVGRKEAVPILLKGLSRLEYRGYDSAGIAVLNGGSRLSVRKKKGKVKELAASIAASKDSPHGSIGLGHTRWATHGAPDDRNAHPHLDAAEELAVVHNGIIENYAELKEKLKEEGYKFRSDTDSEVLAHLVEKYYRKTRDVKEALRMAVSKARGSYAIGVIHVNEPGKITATRVDSPLVLGVGKHENFIASDVSAILEHTREAVSIENGEIVVIDENGYRLSGADGRPLKRSPRHVEWNVTEAEKQGHDHFMIKEIFEQPGILEGLIQKRVRKSAIRFDELKIPRARLAKLKNVQIVACGTSYHAGLVGKYILETLTPLSVSVDNSSEFRYRDPKVDRSSLVILISQSGETADTLAALREAKKRGAHTLAIVNVLGSTIEREADGVIYTYAGPEIAVASTKAYTAQLAALYSLAFHLGLDVFTPKTPKRRAELLALLNEFRKIPGAMSEFLEEYKIDKANWDENCRVYNRRYHESLERYFKTAPAKRKRAPNAFFMYLGRNVNYPTALEGALKLKEIAYISAEGYAAGEMKHGPIALIDENPWVVCIAVDSPTYEKMVSNIEEIKARGGMITAIVTKGNEAIKKLGLYLYIEVPKVSEFFSPLVVVLPLQLIAYHVAKEYKEEIDQPRNLAKSVTVE
jgi:glucosamine--fructose-6-phosphate aminotransferase (isomerizing)